MYFFPYSPVEIPRGSNGLVAGDKDSMSSFWKTVNSEIEEGLSESVGCYIFGIRAGKGILPWYVGLAEKQSFRKECFTPHKLNHYNQSIANRKGTPVLTLISKWTEGNRYAKPSGNGHNDIRFLETMLISHCIQRNSNLQNIRDTKMIREMVVEGLMNSSAGRNHESVSTFQDLIGVSN
jgi:hypothetical protein